MWKYALLFLCLFALLSHDLSAQRKRSRSSDNSFTDKLWYGGGFILGFGGNGNQTQFQFGLSPMVGYKISDRFSLGPRLALTYIHFRDNSFGELETANPVTYGLGAFGRYKFTDTFFGHAEYEYENGAVFTTTLNGLDVLRRVRDNVYLGIGYNSGGVWASEILLLYNVNQPNNAIEQPFVIRFGFTKDF